MTRIALPAMKANRKGTIVNIGSASGSLVPATPLTSVYAGTKVRLVHKLAGKQRAMSTMCSEALVCNDIALHNVFQIEQYFALSSSKTKLVNQAVGMQAYVDVFTRSMQAELAASGVTYQNMAPLFVATKMSKIRKPSIAAPSPAQWARSAVKHIGYETISCPYWFHAVEWYCIAVAPAWLMNMYVLNMHLGMRQRYYKKQNAKAQ